MSREKIRSLLEDLDNKLQERKPFESVPHEFDQEESFPVSMRSVLSGSLGNIPAQLAEQAVTRVLENLPEECQGLRAKDIISKEAIEQENISSSAVSSLTNKVLSKQRNVVNNIIDFFKTNPLERITESLPEQIIYNKLLSDVTAMFLSDNSNDYIAAMLGRAQENIYSEIDSIVAEINDIKKILSDYVTTSIAQVEHLAEVRTFPNLIKVLIDMQAEIGIVLADTASLQSRIFKEGNFSKSRINTLLSHINNILSNNAVIQSALANYDPDATMDFDIKGFADYLERRVKDLINKVKNIGSFKDSIQAEINPVTIFYKNFSRLYGYICDASKRVTENASGWRTSNIDAISDNCNVINDDLYKASVIFDRYMHSNMMKETDEDHKGTVIGRLMEELINRVRQFDTGPLLAELSELLYVIRAIAAQGLLLTSVPFLTFRDEMVSRGIPSNILSLMNFDSIRNLDWGRAVNLDKYLKIDFKSLALQKLIQKGENVLIPLDKLPDVEILEALRNRVNAGYAGLIDGITGLKNVLKPEGTPSFREVLPPVVSDTVDEMATLSSNVNSAINNAEVSGITEALECPEGLTREGSIAMNLKSELGDIDADSDSEITLAEKDAINRAITLFSGDNRQQCADVLIKSEGFGESLSFGTNIDEYVTEVYDNVNAIIDWLKQLSDALDAEPDSKLSSESEEYLAEAGSRINGLTRKGDN